MLAFWWQSEMPGLGVSTLSTLTSPNHVIFITGLLPQLHLVFLSPKSLCFPPEQTSTICQGREKISTQRCGIGLGFWGSEFSLNRLQLVFPGLATFHLISTGTDAGSFSHFWLFKGGSRFNSGLLSCSSKIPGK